MKLYQNIIFETIAPIVSIYIREIHYSINVIEKCVPCDFNNKTIFVIDAAHMTPSVSVHCNGTVNGLSEPKTICQTMSNLLIESEVNFSSLISSHQSSRRNVEYIFKVIPVDASPHVIPILCIFAKTLFGDCDHTRAYVSEN